MKEEKLNQIFHRRQNQQRNHEVEKNVRIFSAS